MDIKIANDEPYQLIKIESINHRNFNNSLDNAYLEFMKSGHQLLRYCLYPKSKKIGRYGSVYKIPADAEIIDDLHEILADVYCLAEYLYSLKPSTVKYDCHSMFYGYKSDKFTKLFTVDKEFELMIQAALELYLVIVAYIDKNYIWSLAYKTFFDETSTLLKVYLKHAKTSKKGGDQKGINFSEPKQKALNYHDKHFTAKRDNGKWLYSNDKTAREIIKDIKKKEGIALGYSERTLSNIISKHRRGLLD